MQLLVWIMGFLVLLSIVAYGRLDSFVLYHGMSELYLNKCAATKGAEVKVQKILLEAQVENKEEKSSIEIEAIEEVAQKEDAAPQKEMKAGKNTYVYLNLPPHNAKLNLAAIFSEFKKAPSLSEKECPFFHLSANLIKYLYKDQTFFNAHTDNLHFEILQGLLKSAYTKKFVASKRLDIENKGKCYIKTVDDLASVDFNNEPLQEAFYCMLKGSKFYASPDQNNYPSLLEHITFEATREKYKINVHHATKELFAAIFQSEEIAEKIVSLREELYKKGYMRLKSKKHSEVSTLFLTEEMVKEILEENKKKFMDYEHLLDFKAGRPSKEELPKDLIVAVDDKKSKLIGKRN